MLRAGQLDELELHVVPILLGQGRRLFDNLPAERVELDLIRRMTTSDVEPAQHVMHLRYRVRRHEAGTGDADASHAPPGYRGAMETRTQ